MIACHRLPGVLLLIAVLCPAVTTAESDGGSAPSPEARGPWTLEQNNWQEGTEILPEPILRRVRDGDYRFDIGPVDPVKFRQNYSDAFWQASAANEGKFDLDPETCGLVDKQTGAMPEFFFGFPFPNIDPKDPQAGCKIAWNFRSASFMGNGGGATFTLNGVADNGEFKRIKLWLKAQSFIGRHGGPIDNPKNLRGVQMVNVLEPHDIDGVGGFGERVNDWKSQDRAWFFVPATRRVRRVNAATRSDPVAGLDLYADDGNCYAGKVEYYRWKLVGEGKVLAPLIGPYSIEQKKVGDTRWEVAIPYLRAAYETPGATGAPWRIVENLSYVVRPVWIVEGKSEDPFYNFGKVIMYFDKELYRIYWKLVHNRAGEYFYNAQCSYHFSHSPDRSFSAVTQNGVIGVNDKTNRAALGGRYDSQFVEHAFEEGYFQLLTLTRMSD